MTTENQVNSPPGFRKVLQDAVEESGLSLRDVASKARISHPFLSRIIKGVRGLPSDEIILRLAKVLGIQPPDRLLYEAGRTDSATKSVLRKEAAPRLMRALAPLSESDLAKIIRRAEELRQRYHPKP